tara:strand:- start:483 stop:947 length:465 start_codon:yes stop_codon:yes gene_type:complete
MNKKLILNTIIIISFLSLSFAYFVEFVLHHQPCNLCLFERIPYLGSLVLISLLLILKKGEKIILSTVALLFLFGTIVSFYHFGIEQGFFEESLVCNLGNSQTFSNTSELLANLEKTRISCKDVTFKIFGFSLASINTVLSLVLSVTVIRLIIKK